MPQTKDCYSLILNEGRLDRFIKNDLKPLERNQAYFVAILARQKYSDIKLKQPSSNVSRFLVYDKDSLKSEIKRREIELGRYTDQAGTPIPETALAVYIHPNPRDTRRGAFSFSSKLFSLLAADDEPQESADLLRPTSLLMTQIHKLASKKKNYLIFDIDCIDHSNDISMIYIINQTTDNRAKILKTSGGFHVLIDYTDLDNRAWLKAKRKGLAELAKLSDQHGDIMIPIPGCRQGQFSPFFIENQIKNDNNF